MSLKQTILLLSVAFLGSCAPRHYQSVTLSSDTAKVNDSGDFLFENDTLRIRYDFHSRNGHMKFGILNKMKQPLYVNWKESGFVQGTSFMPYWRDQYVSNGYVYDKWFDWNGYWNLRGPYTFSIAKREDQVSFIPPGTELMQFEFIVRPGPAYTMTGWEKLGADASESPEELSFEFSQEQSVLKFRHYLTFSTDAELRHKFALDSYFWASNIALAEGKSVFGPAFDGSEGFVSMKMNTEPSRASQYLGKNKFILPSSLDQEPVLAGQLAAKRKKIKPADVSKANNQAP